MRKMYDGRFNIRRSPAQGDEREIQAFAICFKKDFMKNTFVWFAVLYGFIILGEP